MLIRGWTALGSAYQPFAVEASSLGTLRRRTLVAQRASLAALRQSDRIGDDAFRRLEEEFDWAEMDLKSSKT